MNKMQKLKYYIDSLCVYDTSNDPVFAGMSRLMSSPKSDEVIKRQSDFFKTLSEAGTLKEYISNFVLSNDNVFTKEAAAGNAGRLHRGLIEAVKSDLQKLEELSDFTARDVTEAVESSEIKEILETMPCWETGKPRPPLTKGWSRQTDALCEYHRKNGYGIFAENIAFTWRNGDLTPVNALDGIRLTDLKNYELQRKKAIDNTESFISGHPANNVLLYGDRGTGKSSTVHALLNEYHESGLRMIEIPKSAVAQLPLIRERIHNSPIKFIIYIDDLSFDSNDSDFSELKAALEGSLSGKQSNALIYATSNRRHLIRESFSDRENDINKNDIMQEQLSLSDRFGLTITFLNPNKQEYLDIVLKIAEDRGLTNIDEERLCSAADRWATRKGGRSPRCAKQFIDYLESCELSGRDW